MQTAACVQCTKHVTCRLPFHLLLLAVDAAYRLSTACFFGGIVLTAALDAFVHAMMHWAARRRRRVEGRQASKSSSSPDAASTPDVLHSRASPAASESGECAEDVCSELPQLAGTAQRRHRCNSCTALLAARSAAGEAAESSDEGKDGDIEMGSVAAASVDPLCATAGDTSAPCSPPRCCVRRQPCCAGNPDCCGPTARCYNTGAGPAADEILPGTEAAEVVAVLQSDPHTKDLLRMGKRCPQEAEELSYASANNGRHGWHAEDLHTGWARWLLLFCQRAPKLRL